MANGNMVADGGTRRRRLYPKRSRVAYTRYSDGVGLDDRPVRQRHSDGNSGVHDGSDAQGCAGETNFALTIRVQVPLRAQANIPGLLNSGCSQLPDFSFSEGTRINRSAQSDKSSNES